MTNKKLTTRELKFLRKQPFGTRFFIMQRLSMRRELKKRLGR